MPTTYPTFEQWLEEQFPGTTISAHNAARAERLYRQERFAAEHAPTTVPPCPSWCALEAGHAYDSHMGGGTLDDLDFTRIHTSSTSPDPLVIVQQFEHQHHDAHGNGTLDPPSVYLAVETDLDETAARRWAADLLAAADLLGEITGGRR